MKSFTRDSGTISTQILSILISFIVFFVTVSDDYKILWVRNATSEFRYKISGRNRRMLKIWLLVTHILLSIHAILISINFMLNSDYSVYSGIAYYLWSFNVMILALWTTKHIIREFHNYIKDHFNMPVKLLLGVCAFLGFRYVVYEKYLIFVLLNPRNYLFLSNIWVVEIFLNVLLRTRDSIPTPKKILFSLLLLLYPLMGVNKLRLKDHYDIEFYIVFIILHSIQIWILYIQTTHGSRFFLPGTLRTKLYEKITKEIGKL